MFRKLISATIKNRRITTVLSVIVMLFGIYNYYIMPKQEDPDIVAPFAMIKTMYPGASPEIVDGQVTKKIEDKIVEIEGYENSQSYSRNSISIVVLRLTNEADPEKAWVELRRKMDDLEKELPSGCSSIEVNTELADTAGIILSLSGGNHDYEELEIIAEDLKNKLSRINGISRFDIDGMQKREVKIEIDPEVLNEYKLSFQDIVNIIESRNVEIPSGVIEGENSINVKVSSKYDNIEDIKNSIVYISSETGVGVRLKDIAKVYMGLEDSNYKVKHNGENAVLLTGYFVGNKNIVSTGKKVEKELRLFEKNLIDDIELDYVLFQPNEVRAATNDFIRNLIGGIIFVIIVVLLGMGLRNALIVSTAIPFSILVTFIMMNLFNIKLHQISISALIIALGMLVDNAIVTSDAIQVRIDKGEEKLEACIEGVKEVVIPIFTSTLTTVAAFIPLLMLDSVAGEYIFSVPAVVIIALSASYITALFITPALAFIAFKPTKENSKEYKVRTFFSNALKWAMKRRGITLSISVAMLAFSVFLALNLGLQFFPYADKNMMYININCEQDSNLKKTEEITKEVFDILEEQEEIITYTGSIGDGLPKFYNAIPISTPSKDYAQILFKVEFKRGARFKNNSAFADYLQEEIDSRIAGGTAVVKLLELAEPIGAPVRVRISGDDIDSLAEASDRIKSYLEEMAGTLNIEDDHNDRIYQYHVEIDPDISSYYGLTSYDIQNEINIGLMGREASSLKEGDKEYNIMVIGDIGTKEELENFMIKSSITKDKVPLKSLGKIGLDHEFPEIKKYNRDITITIYSDVKTGYNPVDIERNLEKKISGEDFGDISIVFDGEREKIIEYFGDLGVSAVFAIMMVYVILLFQFQSFMQPLIILVTIPLSVVGSILGLAIFRQPLSFTALLGIVSLAGIVVNNAIILLDYINGERREGKLIEIACRDAVDKRFRPIMLTTTTTVIGLIPLALGGSSLMVPMAVSLMSGLMVSTLLTLVIIPVVYSLLQKDEKSEV